MKRNIHYLLYLIAFILIMIPLTVKEAMGTALGQPAELSLLTIGVIFLIAGKVLVIRQKRQSANEREPIYMDIAIILGLIVMLVWMLIKEL